MRTAIITDTNCGALEKEAATHGIFTVAMPIIIEENTYYEGKDITVDDFFEALYSGKNVSTSQPSPADVMATWDDVLKQGYDEIVYIPMSSGLSQSCATATILSKDYDGRVQVVDNHRISITQWDAALTAKKLADEGKPASEIKEHLLKTAYDASIYIAVDTLDFLKRGGRVTPAAAAIGTVLNIKPILSIQGGKLDSFAKARGIKKSLSIMIDALKHDIDTRFGGEYAHISVATAGAGLTEEEIASYVSTVQHAFPDHKVNYYPLPLSVCTHTGRGAIGTGIFYHKSE